MLRLVPVVILTILIGPVVAGLAGIVAPALGWLPVLGGTTVTAHWFEQAAMAPGFGASVWLSYWTGLATTAVALLLVTLFLAGWWGTRNFDRVAAFTAPLFAVPHAAAAIGLAFLVAPSGWIVRVLSPWLTGFDRPPDWLIINDPAGLTLLAGLVIKEMPFLLLMALAALPQAGAPRRIRAARSLGYGRVWGWLTAVFPSVYAQIRLPVYAV
ncbi:MAG TPA: ABC transporter permease, partial [Devosiaceae bacterium]|nr:ABC transporter permease [Devosiaceae bacterium]